MQFTGDMGAGALLVNPWNVREVYMAILDALMMSDDVAYM